MPSTIQVPAYPHSDTGASGAHRWMNCPGSVGLTKKLGDKARRAGMDAAMGTAAHTLAALCLENQEEPWEYAGVEIEVEDRYKFIVDDEMIKSVQLYVDFVCHLMDKFPGALLHIERDMKSKLHKDAFGSADVSIEVPNERVIIIDFKNGMLPVEPTSPQTKYYGYLACEHLEKSDDVKVVSTYIVQPRAPHHQGPIRRAHYNIPELTEWFTDEVVPAIKATKKKDAHLVVGEHCRFCPARDHCPAITSELMHFNTDVEPVYLTEDELSLQMRRYEAIVQYGEKFLKEEAFKRVKGGTPVFGYKLVEKQSRRVFKETMKVGRKTVKFEEAVKTFGDDAVEVKPRSPAQIEKLVGGKEFVARWSYKPKTGYTLARRSDPKPEVKTLMDQYEPEDLKA